MEGKAMSAERLTEIAAGIGESFGYTDVNAEFVEHADLKIRWIRTGKEIRFFICDYLKGADEQIIRHLLECLFKRIVENADEPYPQDVISFFESEGFRSANRELYLERKGITPDSRLAELYCELIDDDMVEDDDIILGWGPCHRTNQTSVLFKTIAVSEKLKDRSDEDLKLIIYAGCRFIEDFPFGTAHDPRLRKELLSKACTDYALDRMVSPDLVATLLKEAE